MKFSASFSGGKDSFLSIKKMIESGNELVCLIISTKIGDNSWTHNLSKDYFLNFAKYFNCRVVFTECEIDDYEQKFEDALILSKKYGAESCVFGDIDCELHLDWNRERCKNAGIECVMPLIYMDRELVVEEFLDLDVRAIIVKVDEKKLSKSYIGRVLNEELVNELKSIGGVDICGENGEYHTRIEL